MIYCIYCNTTFVKLLPLFAATLNVPISSKTDDLECGLYNIRTVDEYHCLRIRFFIFILSRYLFKMCVLKNAISRNKTL